MNATRFRPADSPCRARFRTVRRRACGADTAHRRRRRSNPGRSRSPTARQQLLAAQHLAGVGQKGFGQGDLAGRQVDLTIAHPRPPRAQVEAEATVAQRAGRRARIRVAAQPQPNPGQQLLEAERFRHVVVGTALEAGDGVGDGRSRGQHDHRRGDALTPQPVERLEAIDVGQADVEDHQVEVVRHRELGADRAAALDVAAVPAAFSPLATKAAMRGSSSMIRIWLTRWPPGSVGSVRPPAAAARG